MLFGVCAGLGSVFALLLPDSSNKPMTDTIDQLELLYGSRASSSSSIEKGGAAAPLNAPSTNTQDDDNDEDDVDVEESVSRHFPPTKTSLYIESE